MLSIESRSGYLSFNINLAVKVFALGASLPILSGIVTLIYWYFYMRTGVDGPCFLYNSETKRERF